MASRTVRAVTLGIGAALAAASLVALGFSLHYAELLADWGLPGLAALLAIASNTAFMAADKMAPARGANARR